MTLNFHAITFNALHGKPNRKNKAWSKLTLLFTDSETGLFPGVELGLLQTAHGSTTIAELEREATDLAKTILREALALIEAQNVTALLEDQGARDEAAHREFAASQESLNLSDILNEVPTGQRNSPS